MSQAPASSRRSLPLLLMQTRETVMGYFRPLLREHGVSEQQWRVIRALKAQGPMETTKLADLCSLHGPSLSGMLTRMEAAELISRTRLQEDQRKFRIALLPRAEALFEAMREGMEQQYREIEARLGAEELEQPYAVLDATMARLESAQDPMDTGDKDHYGPAEN